MRRSSLLTAILLALSACTTSSPNVAPSQSPSPSATSPTPAPPPAFATLTGLRLKDPATNRRPALAVKIDNHIDGRPQVGLDRADVVYEEPVEGGITRFIAIFHSQDATKVGPVRSARLTDLEVLREYGKPLLSFSGAAGYVLKAIRKSEFLVSLPHGRFPSIYRRDSSRWFAPHNLFTSTKDLWRVGRGTSATPAPVLFGFGEPAPPPPSTGAIPRWPRGRKATIPFGGSYTAVWSYDGGSGRYLRWHGNVKHRTLTGGQVTAANVLVMRVATTRSNRDAAAHGTPELELVGSGEFVLLRNGIRIAGRWSRARPGAPTRFTDELGRPVLLAPGNTWIELVPTRIVPKYR